MQFLIFLLNNCDAYDERFDISNFSECLQTFHKHEKSYLNHYEFMLLQMKYWCLVNIKSANTHSESELV